MHTIYAGLGAIVFSIVSHGRETVVRMIDDSLHLVSGSGHSIDHGRQTTRNKRWRSCVRLGDALSRYRLYLHVYPDVVGKSWIAEGMTTSSRERSNNTDGIIPIGLIHILLYSLNIVMRLFRSLFSLSLYLGIDVRPLGLVTRNKRMSLFILPRRSFAFIIFT